MASPTSLSIAELVQRSGTSRRTIVYYIQKGLLPRVGRRGPNTRYPAACLHRLNFVSYIKELQDDGELPTVTLDETRRLLAELPPEALASAFDAGPGPLAREVLPPARLRALLAAAEDATPAAGTLERRVQPPPGAGPQPATHDAPGAGPRDWRPGPAAPAAGEHGGDRTPATAAPSPRPVPARQRSYGLADAGIRQRPERPVTTHSHHAAPESPDERPATGTASSGTGHSDPQHAASLPPAAPQDSMPAGTTPASDRAAAPEHGVDPDDLGALLRELELRPAMNPRRQPPGAPEQWTEVPIASRLWLSVRGLPAEDMPLLEAAARLLKKALRDA